MNATTIQRDLYSWYAASEEIKQLLMAAVENWENTPRSQKFILQAIEHPETNIDTLISAYRYFFYKKRNCMARSLAMRVMDSVQQAESLPQEWEELEPILIKRFLDKPIRIYLSAYTALGVMLARWGALKAAIEIASRIHSIDEKDEFGAGALLRILNSHLEDEMP